MLTTTPVHNHRPLHRDEIAERYLVLSGEEKFFTAHIRLQENEIEEQTEIWNFVYYKMMLPSLKNGPLTSDKKLREWAEQISVLKETCEAKRLAMARLFALEMWTHMIMLEMADMVWLYTGGKIGKQWK